jgi:uridine phosphorylase
MSTKKTSFHPEHINATKNDLEGNEGIGRYVFLPSSDGRAKEIAENFDNLVVKSHAHGHNLYLGTLQTGTGEIAVASISTGMGCPSTEIIVHELFNLGAKRFLRVGTAGSLQKTLVKVGDIVNAQAAVRDENTTTHYAPLEFPTIASLEFASSIMIAAERMGFSELLHTGVVHCKSSLYAREFGAGPRAEENKAYIDLLTDTGVLATEMESAALFIQAQIYNHQLQLKGVQPKHRVLAGTILSIIATVDGYESSDKVIKSLKNGIELALETVKTLAIQELID